MTLIANKCEIKFLCDGWLGCTELLGVRKFQTVNQWIN